MVEQRWLKQHEAAAYVGITPQTFYEWKKSGRVKAHGDKTLDPRLLRYDRLELDALFAPDAKRGGS